jgi:hypothetical protein
MYIFNNLIYKASYHVARQISILQNDKKTVYKIKIYDVGEETKIRTVARKLNEYCDDFSLIKQQNDKESDRLTSRLLWAISMV